VEILEDVLFPSPSVIEKKRVRRVERPGGDVKNQQEASQNRFASGTFEGRGEGKRGYAGHSRKINFNLMRDSKRKKETERFFES